MKTLDISRASQAQLEAECEHDPHYYVYPILRDTAAMIRTGFETFNTGDGGAVVVEYMEAFNARRVRWIRFNKTVASFEFNDLYDAAKHVEKNLDFLTDLDFEVTA
jgi:hypothetical protein